MPSIAAASSGVSPSHSTPIVTPPAVSPDGILFLYSPNLALRVQYGSLVIDLGRGRSLTVDRASEPRLRRLVIAGHGWWTFEVPAWLAGIGASWIHLNLTGRILGSGPGEISPDLPALRRQQALAAGSEVGLAIGRELISRKILGQAAALGHRPDVEEAQTMMREHIDLLDTCPDAAALRTVEARAAALFWEALAEVPVRFIPADEAKVPAAWRNIGRRASAVTGAPRGASTAAQSVWNFAYSCAAAEVEIGLRCVALDPGISPTGLHADTPNRSSATYDALEAIRGDIDRLVLAMIAGRRFRRRDFVQQPDGRVRLTAPLAREVAEAVMPVAREAVAPIAEELARTLAGSATGAPSQLPKLPTNLTGDARSRGRNAVRKAARKQPDASKRVTRALIPPACKACGEILPSPSKRRTYCETCAADVDPIATFSAAGVASLARLRAEGRDPSASGAARAKVGETNAKHRLARAEWEKANPGAYDPVTFSREILPRLQGVPLSRLVAASGLSLYYCSKVRRGLVVPHAMHWAAFTHLTRDPLQR